MKITVLGTGMVGKAIAERLVAVGHQVSMGTRDPEALLNKPAQGAEKGSFSDWAKANAAVKLVAFRNVPTDADLIVNATNGQGSLAALQLAGKDRLKGKVILDVANPLDFSNGMPPSLSVCNTDSLGEQIQRAFPESHVVKSLNTMNCYLMMNPSLVAGDHNVFLSGDAAEAKKVVSDLLMQIGWKQENILDLGDIKTARGTEMLLPIWLQLWGTLGTPQFNFKVVKN